MALLLYTAARNAAANAVVDLIDADASAGRLEIRTDARPAVNAALTGTLLASIDFDDPAFGDAAAGVATAAGRPNEDPSADATGTAGYGAVVDDSGDVVFTGTVGTSGSGADFILSTLSIVAGQPVSLESMTFTQPDGS